MKIILKILLYIPWITLKGTYRCASYGNTEQLFELMLTLGIFFLNIKCSKSIGPEDYIILNCFIYIMHYFSKLTKENLLLQKYGDLAKVIMSILHRQNRKDDIHVRTIEKEIKKISGPKIVEKPKVIFVEQKVKKDKELPKGNTSDVKPKYPVIELNESEYKTINGNENIENNEMEE